MLIMRAILIAIAFAGCGSDPHPSIDAATPFDAAPDADVDAPLAVDCPTYCAEVQANCTGDNAQYSDTAHCLAACASFPVGDSKVTDTSGNTLGCRIYHGGAPSMAAPATHCAHAGPGGDLIGPGSAPYCSGGDVCESFCRLQIQACGSRDAPLPGNPRDVANNPLYRYDNMADCVSGCADFDKTHPYSLAAAGDSLACRLYHATAAAVAVMPDGATHCAHTAYEPTGPCAGTPRP